MPTLSALDSGFFPAVGTTSWSAIRDATSVSFTSATNNESSIALWNEVVSGRGGTVYRAYRAYASFDTSGITQTPQSATLKLRGSTNIELDFAGVKASAGSTVSADDFDAIVGWDSSGTVDNTSNVTKYFSDIDVSTFGTGITVGGGFDVVGYNSISLNATALTDMKNLSKIEIMFIGLLDLAGTEPSLGTSQVTGLTLSPSTAGFPIKIEYVEAAAENTTYNNIGDEQIISANTIVVKAGLLKF